MSRHFLLTGKNAAYRVENGNVALYATRLEKGKPGGRLHYFKSVRDGEVFLDYPPIETLNATWACMAKRVGGAKYSNIPEREADFGKADEFARFIGALEEELEKETTRFRQTNTYNSQVLSEAVTRLAKVNTSLSERSWDQFEDDDNVKVCKVLCNYLKVEPKVPSEDISENFTNFAEEILYLSGIRHKEVSLPDDWWKYNNGPMIGYFEDGTPVALLPRKIRGYRAYNPKSNTTYKVNADTASGIKPHATAVFRTFPAKKIGLREIIDFMFGENIYKEIAAIALCSFFASVISIIPPVIAAQIFDTIVPENLRVLMVEVVLILIAFELAKVGFNVMINLGVSRINTKCGLIMQAALWDRLLSLRVPFFSHYTTGELLQKIKSIDQVKNLISTYTLQNIFSNLFSFIYIIALFNFSAAITPYVLLMFLGLFAVHAAAGKRKYTLYKRCTDLENKAVSFARQCLGGMQRIKASSAEERVFNIWSAYETDKRSIRGKIKMIDNALDSFLIFFDFASTAAVYFLIAYTPDIGMGIFIAYASTFLIFRKSMGKLLKALGILPELIAVCANVKPILDAEPEYSAQKIIPKDMSGTLEANHVTFRFGQYGYTILHDISLRIEEGESIGIVGLSGGGKTTLLKVLMGFYDPTEGKIYYGGYDLETIDMRYLRKQMGVVLQNGRLAVGDIYGNITDNDYTVRQEAVMDAIGKVGLEEKIDALPDGLHTKLELCPLSEGERQRLLIARAIVKKNKFIFLDEATSSLDNISQSMIIKNLNGIPATKIIVTQRLATVQYCDRIIVLEHGRIVMKGSYSQICEKSRPAPPAF